MFQRLDSRADVLSQVLDAAQLGSVLSSRTELRAPWALRYGATGNRAGFHVVVDGECWVRLDEGREPPIALGPGDIVVFPHGAGHTLGDRPEGWATALDSLVAGLAPGDRRELAFGGDGARTVLLCGSYAFAAGAANPLLRGLPSLIHVPAALTRGSALAAAIELLAAEVGDGDSGMALVVERLVDLLFVYALRAWLGQQDDASLGSWFGALQDPALGPTIRAIHNDPARQWTVAALADQAGMSRATFARRFSQAVGEPPLAYVTRWRMTTATDLLARGERIASVAHQVGYDNEFAFAKAYKRVRGIAPGQLRRRAG